MTKKSSNRRTAQAISSTTKDESPRNIDKTYKTWQLLLVGCSIFGAGFAAGKYMESNNVRIETQDKINDYREHIIELGKEHEKEIHDCNLEIYRLADENNDLKDQIRQLKSTKK